MTGIASDSELTEPEPGPGPAGWGPACLVGTESGPASVKVTVTAEVPNLKFEFRVLSDRDSDTDLAELARRRLLPCWPVSDSDSEAVRLSAKHCERPSRCQLVRHWHSDSQYQCPARGPGQTDNKIKKIFLDNENNNNKKEKKRKYKIMKDRK